MDLQDEAVEVLSKLIQFHTVNPPGNERAGLQGLADYLSDAGLEVELDGAEPERPNLVATLRGRGALPKRGAVANLEVAGVRTTLVCTVARGVNDAELGKIVDFAVTQPCVRGVTFQPVQDAGRTQGYDPARDRLTLTEVRRRILEQTSHRESWL